MKNKRQTAINLTAQAQEIKNRVVQAFSLKMLVSAGFYLFDKLSDGEKIDLISRVSADEQAAEIVAAAEADAAKQRQKKGRQPSKRL